MFSVLPALFGELIPLSAIVLSMAIAFWAMYLGHQRRRLQFEERRLMIEKGMTPPPLPVEERRRTPESQRRIGIILVSLAIGFVVAGAVDAVPGRGSDGLRLAAAIVGFLGIGFLVNYAFMRKQPPSLPPAA